MGPPLQGVQKPKNMARFLLGWSECTKESGAISSHVSKQKKKALASSISPCLIGRTFDPMKDEHPVSWLIQSLKPDLYPALADWIDSILGESSLRPQAVIMPETLHVQLV